MRIATPSFQLFTAPLTQAVEQGKMQVLSKELRKLEYMRQIKLLDNALPMSLRWNMHPEFGFPRQPFNVYRRRSVYNGFTPVSLLNSSVTISNNFIDFYFPSGQEMYISVVAVALTAGQSLQITPFDRDKKAMTGKSKRATSSGSFIFKCPFTAGFTINGTGKINNIAGISMQSMLDAKDWELIQIVGLPFKKGVVGGQGYNGDNQGYISALTDAETASLQRLKIGELLFTPPPSTGDPVVPDPLWIPVDAYVYLNNLFNASDSILDLINKCMTASDDLSYFRTKRQPAYVEKRIISGIHQPGGGPPKPAEAKIPVVGTTLLSVTTESPAALGLGFGTTDFVSRTTFVGKAIKRSEKVMMSTEGSSTLVFGYDYMVSGKYVIRPFENFNPLGIFDDLSKELEFCALSDDRALPVSPVNAQALSLRTNRPEDTDLIFTEAVKLRWSKPPLQQGYGVIASYKNGSSEVLNTEYDFYPDAYKNFNTYVPKTVSTNPDEQVLPNEDDNDNEKFVMVEPEEPLPFRGSELHKYFVAGWDVFGRWSNFIRLNHLANAPAKQNPGVLSIRLFKTNPEVTSDLSPINPNVPCTLEVEIGWYWADRTPSKIQVGGLFFNAANNVPPAAHPNHFSITSVDVSTPIITISFDLAGNPTSSAGSVFKVTNTVETPTDLRKIKLIINNITATFPAGPPDAVAYAVYVRGLEKVRALPLPEDWGNWSDGYLSRMEDPRPPAVTFLPATVQFTAMPDATKLGRGRLTWPVAANALGYYVWEASETAVRAALDEHLKTQFPGDPSKYLKPLTDSLVDRATQLRDLLAQSQYQNLCQRAFNKLTREMIRETSVELEISASSKVLTLYQVSSINTANIESGKSNVVFFAVPQLNKPAPPLLMLRKFKKEDPVTHDEIKGIQVKVLNGIGLAPSGFNLYRTRKILIGNDAGTKGLPVKEFNSADWKPYSMRMQDGEVYNGSYIEEAIVNGSWRPYVYQAVAVGEEDSARGFFRGESDPSSTEVIFFPPEIPPTLIIQPPLLSNSNSKVMRLSTSAPFDKIDIGKSIIELYNLGTDNKRTLLKTFEASNTIISGTDLAPVSGAIAATWPAISRKPTDLTTGITQFSVGVKISVTRLLVRIIDPLSRAAEASEEA
jgi:hypothetical protein